MINLVLRQSRVGGCVGHQREPHGQGGAGQGDGHAAVRGPHHPDDRVRLQARIPVFSLNQPLCVLECFDGLDKTF